MDELDEQFYKKVEKIEKEYDELSELLSSNEVLLDNRLYLHYLMKQKKIEDIAILSKKLNKIKSEIGEYFLNLELYSDKEIKTEFDKLSKEFENTAIQIKLLMSNSKISENQNIIIEITHKDSEQVSDFYKIIQIICDQYDYFVNERISGETCETFKIYGKGAYEKFKNFIGQVRFTKNKITENAKVCVLLVDDSKFEFDEKDVQVETLKSGGAGGQHINKTESAVRLIHKPTGISVKCQGERSQTQNKAEAMEKLKNKVQQNFEKNRKKQMDLQRNKMKNAFFSETPSAIFDYDKNAFVIKNANFNENLTRVLDGFVKIII